MSSAASSLIASLQGSQDPDARVLLQMLELGANLARPHRPEFAFDMPSLETAEGITQALEASGWLTECFGPDDDNPDFLVIARREMLLDLAVLNDLSRQFEALAATHGGVYDGWGAEIVE